MSTFYSGDLTIHIQPKERQNDPHGKTLYHGVIESLVGNWRFDDLASHRDEMGAVEDAIAFGSYYSSDNRGEDCPDWAPTAQVADWIDSHRAYPPEGYDARDFPDLVVHFGDAAVVFESQEDETVFWDEVNKRDLAANTRCSYDGKPVSNAWYCSTECEQKVKAES